MLTLGSYRTWKCAYSQVIPISNTSLGAYLRNTLDRTTGPERRYLIWPHTQTNLSWGKIATPQSRVGIKATALIASIVQLTDPRPGLISPNFTA